MATYIYNTMSDTFITHRHTHSVDTRMMTAAGFVELVEQSLQTPNESVNCCRCC